MREKEKQSFFCLIYTFLDRQQIILYSILRYLDLQLGYAINWILSLISFAKLGCILKSGFFLLHKLLLTKTNMIQNFLISFSQIDFDRDMCDENYEEIGRLTLKSSIRGKRWSCRAIALPLDKIRRNSLKISDIIVDQTTLWWSPEYYNQKFKYSFLIQQISKFESNGLHKSLSEMFNVHICIQLWIVFLLNSLQLLYIW